MGAQHNSRSSVHSWNAIINSGSKWILIETVSKKGRIISAKIKEFSPGNLRMTRYSKDHNGHCLESISRN